jgi:transmembrane sensor
MAKTRDEIEEEAIGWVITLRSASARDWEAFARWLEADPRHSTIYDAVALVDADLDALPRRAPKLAVAGAGGAGHAGRTVGRRAVLGWGIAAALVGMIGYASFAPRDTLYEVATTAGERRSVTLADGSRIELNRATRILLDKERPRFARVERGEALFTVVHDDARPFEVEAGDALLRDMGTVFNVVRDEDGSLDVAVAEGAVLFNPGREAVDLRPGMALRQDVGAAPVVKRRDTQAITGWRDGRLVYFDATLAEVAADLSRNSGVPVIADPRLAGRRFSGTILLDRDSDRLLRRAAALMDVEARRTAKGWILTMGAGDTP